MVHSSHSSNTILTVFWLCPAQPNGIIIAYEVNVSTLSTKNYSNVTASNNHTDIQALGKFMALLLKEMNEFIKSIATAPFVPYFVSVAAYTMIGRGPYSHPVINFTQQGSEWRHYSTIHH